MISTRGMFEEWLHRCRESRQLVVVIVAIALLLDNMLLTTVGKYCNYLYVIFITCFCNITDTPNGPNILWRGRITIIYNLKKLTIEENRSNNKHRQCFIISHLNIKMNSTRLAPLNANSPWLAFVKRWRHIFWPLKSIIIFN